MPAEPGRNQHDDARSLAIGGNRAPATGAAPDLDTAPCFDRVPNGHRQTVVGAVFAEAPGPTVGAPPPGGPVCRGAWTYGRRATSRWPCLPRRLDLRSARHLRWPCLPRRLDPVGAHPVALSAEAPGLRSARHLRWPCLPRRLDPRSARHLRWPCLPRRLDLRSARQICGMPLSTGAVPAFPQRMPRSSGIVHMLVHRCGHPVEGNAPKLIICAAHASCDPLPVDNGRHRAPGSVTVCR